MKEISINIVEALRGLQRQNHSSEVVMSMAQDYQFAD